MIEDISIDGRPATVAYLKGDFEPVSKGEATFARIIFDDGESMFVSMPQSVEKIVEYDSFESSPVPVEYDSFTALEKFNPWHDELGRFASGPGSAGGWRKDQEYEPRVYANGGSSAQAVKKAWTQASPYTEVERATAVALANQEELANSGRSVGKEIADEMGGGVTWQSGAPKTHYDNNEIRQEGIDRILEKAADPMRGGVGGVTDIVRGSFIIDDPAKVDAIVGKLGERYEVISEGFTKNKWGYMDATAMVRLPDGMVAEVQFKEPNLYKSQGKNTDPTSGSGIYTRYRSYPKGSPELAHGMELSNMLYGAAMQKASPAWQRKYARARAR